VAVLNLGSVDELIAVREDQHGGARGAPRVNDGTREGQAVNRAVVIMTSATLQAFCEDVFFELSELKLALNLGQMDVYKKLYSQWGNPSKDNIRKHFSRLGAIDVLQGLSWRACGNAAVIRKLDRLNNLRNQIAHGKTVLSVDGKGYSLSLARARDHRTFAFQFGVRFEAHARNVLGLPTVPNLVLDEETHLSHITDNVPCRTHRRV
jgi:RiboL-PSP-HEPN